MGGGKEGWSGSGVVGGVGGAILLGSCVVYDIVPAFQGVVGGIKSIHIRHAAGREIFGQAGAFVSVATDV